MDNLARASSQYDARAAETHKRAEEQRLRPEIKATQPQLNEMIDRIAHSAAMVEEQAMRAKGLADSIFGPVPEAESADDRGTGAGRLGSFYGVAERLSAAIVDLDRQLRRLESL